jgi:hypothetical protein
MPDVSELHPFVAESGTADVAHGSAGSALPPFEEDEVGMDRAPGYCVAVTTADVITMRKEFERWKRAWSLFDASAAENGAKASSTPKRPAGPGGFPAARRADGAAEGVGDLEGIGVFVGARPVVEEVLEAIRLRISGECQIVRLYSSKFSCL